MHPALLGSTAQHMPLIAAAVHVACIRAPQVVFGEFEALAGEGSAKADIEIRRALQWLGAKCAEPAGLTCAHQDPATGELLRLPTATLWGASIATDEPSLHDGTSWPELEPFRRAAAQALGRADFDPRIEIVVSRTELDAHLGPEAALLDAWLLSNFDELLAMLRRVTGPEDAPIADWARPLVERLVELARLRSAFTFSEPPAAPQPQPQPQPRPKTTTKAAVATVEGEYRRRWANGEFETSQAARDALALELNTRPDGTCAKPEDPDHHARGTIDRLTRGWFS